MAADLTREGEGGTAPEGAGRALRVRYALLTAGLFLPLLWASATMRNVYPVSAAAMMIGGGRLEAGRTYYVLRGETVAGETVELPFLALGDSVHSRASGLIAATVRNDSLRLPRRLHPSNTALVTSFGGADKLPEAVRLPELLRAIGGMHNGRLPADSGRRLRAVLLDQYRWEGGRYADYDRLVKSWREAL